MSSTATILLLGSGELGREFAIAAKRLGCRVVACDRYANAPAMQCADASEVFAMLDGAALRAAVEKHRPDVIVPEIEARWGQRIHRPACRRRSTLPPHLRGLGQAASATPVHRPRSGPPTPP